MLHNKTGLFLFLASNDILEFDNVWMVERLVDEVFTLDFLWFDWKQDLDGYFLLVFSIVAFEDVSVFSSSELLGDCIIFDVAE